jgi:hypothetical protein
LIALPVAAGSWLNAHCLAYVLVPPADTEHMHHHVEAGHSYFGSAPVLIATAVTLLAAGLILCLRDGMRGRAAPSQQPAALFALLPPLGFAVQEHIEQLIVTGSLPHDLGALSRAHCPDCAPAARASSRTAGSSSAHKPVDV